MGGHLVENQRILLGVGGDGGEGMVLGRRADQRRPANVDLLDGLGRASRPARAMVASKGYRFTTTSSKVRMPCSARAFMSCGIVVAAEDAAVDLGMERLQPAVHHFRKAGVLGDVADGDAFASRCLRVPPVL